MKVSDIVKGAIVVAAVAGFFYFTNQGAEETTTDQDTQVSQDTTEETQKRIEEQFNTEIPEGADRAELRSEEGVASAIATKEVADTGTNIAILADLDDPEPGKFFQAWILNGAEGSEDFERVSLGRMRIAKGGWVVEYNSQEDLSEFDQITVTEESAFDSEPEDVILQGSFN